jgi:predicted phosphodiesterase
MIFFCGDNHGNFDHIIKAVLRHRPDAIVLFGDVEAGRPLEQELAEIMGLTEVWWIHGNHDTDSQANYDNLFASALADRNLHGKVAEIAGLRVAGLGGVFRESIWYPSTPGAPVHFNSYQDYLRSEKSRAGPKLLTHRSSIFHVDWLKLRTQRADILVTHEAPSCHPNGFSAIDDLARRIGVKATFHGHHHDRINYQAKWPTLGFQAHGVDFCGITNMFGGLVAAGRG